MSDPVAAERYVAGRMSEAEVAEFEALMIERPEIAADVGVRQRIKAGLSLLQERGELAAMIPARTSRSKTFGFAAAAAIAVLVVSGGIVLSQRTGGATALLATAGPGERPEPYLLAEIRGGSETPVVTAPPGAGLVELHMLVAGDTGTEFDARLEQAGPQGRVARGTARIAIGTNGYANVFVRTQELAAGGYVVSLTRAGGGQHEPQSFAFELRKPAP